MVGELAKTTTAAQPHSVKMMLHKAIWVSAGMSGSTFRAGHFCCWYFVV